MTTFSYSPSKWVPFRDTKVIEKARNIPREHIDKHPNEDYQINVVRDQDLPVIRLNDTLRRIIEARDAGKNAVFIMGNPNPLYIHLAWMINYYQVDCSHLYVFNMDEWADEGGNTCSEDWPQSFMRAMKNYFYYRIDDKLRPPEDHIIGPTTDNIDDFGKMMEDVGGVDVCYSGPGWSGHIAFIEPDAPEFDAPLEQWKQMGSRIVTLSPFTIAQNSLHASFGFSGDLAKVPPKAATIGPAEVLAARHHFDSHALTIRGTEVSWQRFMTRLICHGPVTPKVPTSLLQTCRTDVYITETAAANIEPVWEAGY